ncbi:Shikimate dehydrogenase (NADP(+)) [Paraglaciecola mesophila]|uniref:Shikimate dehydrogenase (NADP(+)) n=1 Tax=Paraglaciecola mesophila TaxID=197222 RepID=A0A857JJV2_9ALTE|nr:shikimate dehydrogenase [Paraglaciecola mesophila]QHJ12335.1 Shikimate dehydrogenase (NADP(+)) [Paraglaciecola mesophila]
MDRYAVFGNPIEHSKSPLIHSMFAKQTEQNIEYGRQQPDINGFNDAIAGFFTQGYTGANVTSPFKLDAFRFADELTPRAKAAEAVNTLYKREDGSVLGDNTDGAGLVQDLQRLRGELDGKNLLLIGAGGATRGVILPLLRAQVHNIHIANRTASKAQQLAIMFEKEGAITASGFNDLPETYYDLIVNCTSSSLDGGLPEITSSIFTHASFAYDMTYKARATSFMVWAEKSNVNIKTADGLGMLVGQAAESFYVWRNIRPEIEPVIEAVREML